MNLLINDCLYKKLFFFELKIIFVSFFRMLIIIIKMFNGIINSFFFVVGL